MAITGAVGAFLRRNDPYPDWTFVHDYTGLGPNNPGRPVYKNNGVIYNRPDYDPNFSFTRSGADLIYFNPVENIWKAVEANKTGIDSSGFQIHESTTNKCTNYNAAPTATTNMNKYGDAAATLTVVDDTAALRAAGFGALIDAGKMNGKVYKLDNSAGVGSAWIDVSGAVGNTNPHYPSAFVRGSGTVDVRLTGTAGTNRTLTAQYAKQGPAAALTPAATGNVWRAVATAGSVVYIALNQLEEKAYATNPVIVAGASATRGSTSATILNLASTLTTPFTLVAMANMSEIDGVDRDLADLSATGINSDSMYLVRNLANTALFAMTTGGAVQASFTFPNKAGPRLLKMAWRVRTTTATPAVDGVLGSPATVTPPPLAILTLGSRLGNNRFLKSPLLFVGIAPDMTDAQLQAITASNNLYMDFQ